MKTNQLTRLAAILTLSSAFAFAGCNQSATNTNNANNSNNTNNTNSTSNANAGANSNTAANSNTTAATSKEDFSSPTATIKSFYEAVKANDIAAMKKAFDKPTLAQWEQMAIEEKRPLDDIFKDMIKEAGISLSIRNEQISGDKATIETKDDRMGNWEKLSLVKEDGQWKITLAERMAAAAEETAKRQAMKAAKNQEAAEKAKAQPK